MTPPSLEFKDLCATILNLNHSRKQFTCINATEPLQLHGLIKGEPSSIERQILQAYTDEYLEIDEYFYKLE